MTDSKIRHYYVDEAGDGTIFDAKGRIIIGKEGCSRFFMLGLLDVSNPKALETDIKALRSTLLKDPYFKNVPSMQLETKKTAALFHAKDDLPEVRREVFRILMNHDVSFFAIVRDKTKLLEYVRHRNEVDNCYRYNINELYDFLIRQLFQGRLHQHDAYEIHFAKRGKADRTEALKVALDAARLRFAQKYGKTSSAFINVLASDSKNIAGLQAVDYFLWSLQRFYERGESRYMDLLWPAFHLVRDIDDTRENQYGEYYTQKSRLQLRLKKHRGYRSF
jgi:hypothetical protein